MVFPVTMFVINYTFSQEVFAVPVVLKFFTKFPFLCYRA